MDRNLKLLDKEKPHGFANYYVIHGTENVNTVGVNKSVWQKKKMTHENLSSLKSEYIAKIEAIPTVSFNKEQKEIAKRIIQNTDEKDLHSVFGLITQRVKTGFVFDEAPEVNHNAVALVKEWQELNIGDEASCFVDENTEHTLIIGENYDALKNLCATYIDKSGKGLVDVIYIDPPYNTDASKADGNDYKEQVESNKFIYRDKFTRDGWLNMMNERLKLAKKLLSDKGVIFISIDDSEQAYLKVLCDEIFGEENFVATIPWRKRTAKSDVPFGVSQDFEYIVCYARSDKFIASVEGKERRYYETPDFPNRPWRTHDMTKQTTAKERPNSFFTMINPKNGDEFPCDPNRTWRITKDTFQKYYDANEIIFPGDYDFLKISRPVARYFKDNDMEKDGERFGLVPLSTKLPDEVGMNQNGTKEIKSIFSDISFSFPKPVNLIKYLVKAATPKMDCHVADAPRNDESLSPLILDFFAGSGTTGQAVMELNAEDGGKRKVILVTNNENSIGEKITRERLYRVINGKGSKDESISWKYSENQPCLKNNSVRVFKIENHQLTLNDLQKAEELKESAKIEFKKLNPNFDTSNDFDIYNELASLNPYKE